LRQGHRTFFLKLLKRLSNELLALALIYGDLSNELLAPDWIESWHRLSTGELLAPVFLQRKGLFSINELLAPLD